MTNQFSLQSAQESVVLVFAKEPVPGRVKTRLCPPLSAAESAAVYAKSLQETILRLQEGFGTPLLAVAGDPAYFLATYPQVPFISQQGVDLGERMAYALAQMFARGARKAVIVGSDTPDLPLQIVADALTALDHADAVVAPAADGGYVLIGARERTPDLFCDVDWSTPEVLAQTRARAQKAGIRLAEVAGWEDLDDLGSLRRLVVRSPQSMTAGYLLATFPSLLAENGSDRS